MIKYRIITEETWISFGLGIWASMINSVPPNAAVMIKGLIWVMKISQHTIGDEIQERVYKFIRPPSWGFINPWAETAVSMLRITVVPTAYRFFYYVPWFYWLHLLQIAGILSIQLPSYVWINLPHQSIWKSLILHVKVISAKIYTFDFHSSSVLW